MKALDRAIANVCSLLIAIIMLIHLGRNAPCNFWGWDPIVEEQGRR